MTYHQDSCRSCAFTPNGLRFFLLFKKKNIKFDNFLVLASGSKDKSIGLIDGSTGKMLLQLEEAHSYI